MKKVDIEHLKDEDYVDYIDGDLFLIEDVNKLPTIKENAIEVDAIVVIFCVSGEGQVIMNGREYIVKRRQMLMGMPRSVFAYYKPLTADFEVKIIGISMRVFNSSVSMTKSIWKNFYFLINNPLLDMEEHEVKLLLHYYELANLKMQGKESPFHQAIMMSLLHCVIFELLTITDRIGKISNEDEESMTQGNIIFKHFVELLSESDGRIRSVAEFADMLYVTPKYLSTVVKQVSGRTAIDLIHETSTHAIVRLLKYTDKSIKEITNEMNFSSISFFGKYVKAQLGVSPKNFRKGKERDEQHNDLII